jgi:hypothetical protein
MTPIEKTKEDLFVVIEKLPEHRLAEVLQFANFLLYSQEKNWELKKEDSKFSDRIETKGGDRDPLSNFLGAIESGSLAQNIDKELYE